MSNTEAFITRTWPDTIVSQKEDSGTLIGLPYPFSCPTVGSTFREMYYWDTYFTNKGLLVGGFPEQAKHNVDNMLYLVEKYGFMPNGNRTTYLYNTQEPFLSHMVMDIYRHFGDRVWLQSAYETLQKEYAFWQTRRIAPNGLNRYGCNTVPQAEKEKIYADTVHRLGDLSLVYGDRANDLDYVVACQYAECEGGWDCTPRMMGRKILCNAVDCNTNLYEYERSFAYMCRELGIDGAEAWDAKAARRAETMRTLLWNGDCFNDYDFDKQEQQTLVSAAVFYPLAAGLCTAAEAVSTVRLLPKLEYPHGISTCERRPQPIDFQWDYPNGWPCQQYQVVRGLANYGYGEDARRIAGKYVALVDTVFEKTGNLWEKYNVADGSINVKNEYDMPAMMGWTAGVYLAFRRYLDTGTLV